MPLTVTAVGANLLKDVDLNGTQDPYLQVTLNIEDKKSFQKTRDHEDAGLTPQWDQFFSLDYSGESLLYVEVLDKEHGVDQIIGFSAIPLNQVQGAVNGLFPIYDRKQEKVGTVHLVIQKESGANTTENPEYLNAIVDEEHLARIEKVHKKEIAGDVAAGVAIAGGIAALGFFINKNARNEQ
ncbi:unnamed protein product [Cunninghamella blakesleeana]